MMQNFGLEDLSHVQSRRNLLKYLVRVEMASDWLFEWFCYPFGFFFELFEWFCYPFGIFYEPFEWFCYPFGMFYKPFTQLEYLFRIFSWAV